MIGHLGTRTSALLDGRLSADETERAWEHVHGCHACRDLVEREGWVKTRLAGLAYDGSSAPAGLKGSLLGAMTPSAMTPSAMSPAPMSMTPGESYLTMSASDHRRRNAGLAAIGGGAIGAAVMGVLALGAAPADAPSINRPAPASITQTQTQAPRPSVPSEQVALRLAHSGSRQR